MALPHQEHFEAVFNVMLYLSLHHNSHLCINPKNPMIDSTQFPMCDWREYYGEVEEPIPPNTLEADLCMFVNNGQMGDQCT